MTWMNEDGKDSFPPLIWNHHNTTDSPRTNNHMEGFNRSLNFHVITSKPSIYELIINLKTIEIQISAYFKNRVFNGLPKKKNRNIEDIERDIKIAQLKYRFLNDQITLESYMKSIAYIYSYERIKSNDKLGSPVKIKNHLTKHYYYDYFQGNSKHPNLDSLQNKSYAYIENYFSVHRSGFIDTIKKFRSYNTVNYYNNEEIDYNCTEFFNYSQFIWPIKTTSDGNCLFHATSISIYGNESES
jgi:hypothetical protein